MAGSRTVRRLLLAGALAVAGVTMSGCSLSDLPRYGWPRSATAQGEKMQHLWSGMGTAALAVGVIVWGLMIWCFIVYRKRRNSPLYPKQTRENLPVEMIYTAVPFLMVAVIFYFGTTVQNEALKMDPNPDVTVGVTAFKWNWGFAYAATDDNQVYDAVVPTGGTVLTDDDVLADNSGKAIHTIGTSGRIPILILPVHKTIEYVLSSKDVVHSFWVPAYDFKRDVFPYPGKNDTKNLFQTTLTRTGAWVGHCAELCGTYHSAMNFEVRSVPDDIFDAYIAARKDGLNQADALQQVGDSHPDCGTLCSPTATTTYPLVTDRQAKHASEPPPNVTVTGK